MARGTVMVHGSDGEVMAQFGTPETFYRGKRQNIKIVDVSRDKDVPLDVRKSLVGLVIPTIFTKESIEEQTGATFPIPAKSRLAYASDVIEVLESAGKQEAAKQLKRKCPNDMDMYVIEKQIYATV